MAKQLMQAVGLPLLVHLALVGAGVLLGLCLDAAPAWEAADQYPPLAEAPTWLQPLLHWDVHLYSRLSAEGYTNRTIVLMPVLPKLVSIMAALTGLPGYVIGLVVANLAGILSFFLLALLAREYVDAKRARQVVWSLAVLPTSFYLNTFYTEPLFLALVLGCLISCRKMQYLLAGMLAAAATLTRNLGIGLELVLLGAIVPVLRQRPASGRLWVSLALAPVALLGFCLYQQIGFGDALAFVHQQSQWGRQYHLPWEGFWDSLRLLADRRGSLTKGDLYLCYNLVLGTWAVGGTGWMAWQARRQIRLWGIVCFSAFLVLVPLLTGSTHDPLFSLSRYVLVVPAAHLAMGYVPARWFWPGAVVAALGLVVAMALFSRGWWIA